MHLERSELDGIPLLHAPAPGDVQAALLFRVGKADETLATSGVTHLVEHLALHRLGRLPYEINGFVGATITGFTCQGEPSDVRAFLTAVAAALQDLPTERLEHERQVLLTEQAGRGRNIGSTLAVWRFGAQTYGLVGADELGLHRLVGDDVRAWSTRYFTSGNAAIWTTGDLGDDFTLDLPDGPRYQPPEPSSALPQRPAYFAQDTAGAAFSALVPRSPEMVLATAVLDRRLREHLRDELGLSYAVSASYDSVDRNRTFVSAYADAAPASRSTHALAFVTQIHRLVQDGTTQTELDRTRAESRPPRPDDRAQVAGVLHHEACDVLFGADLHPYEHWESIRARLTTDQVDAALQAMFAETLFVVPAESLVTQELRRFDVAEAPLRSDHLVEPARAFLPLEFPAAIGRLVVSDTGVSRTGGVAITVMFASCAALLAWPDGRRELIGVDGFRLEVEPTLWQDGAELVRLIDAGVPSDRVIPMARRPDEDVPQPTAPWYRRRLGMRRLAAGGIAALVAVTVLITAVAGSGAVAMVIPFGLAWGVWNVVRDKLRSAELAARSVPE